MKKTLKIMTRIKKESSKIPQKYIDDFKKHAEDVILNPTNYLKDIDITKHSNAPLYALASLFRQLNNYNCFNCSSSIQRNLNKNIESLLVSNIENMLPYLISNSFSLTKNSIPNLPLGELILTLRSNAILNSEFEIIKSKVEFTPQNIWNNFRHYEEKIENSTYIEQSYTKPTRCWKQEGGNFTRVKLKDKSKIDKSTPYLPYLPFTEHTVIKPLDIFIGKIKSITNSIALPIEINKNRLFVLAKVLGDNKVTYNKNDYRLIQFYYTKPLLKSKSQYVHLHWMPANSKGRLLHSLGTYFIVGYNKKNEPVAFCHGHDTYIYPYID